MLSRLFVKPSLFLFKTGYVGEQEALGELISGNDTGCCMGQRGQCDEYRACTRGEVAATSCGRELKAHLRRIGSWRFC